MGNTLQCPCSNASDQERVLVMRADGGLITYRKGVHAHEVVESHAGHSLVRCGSDRRIVPGWAELENKRLYFLMPENMAGCRETYEKFWRAGESKGLLPPVRSTESNDEAMAVAGRVLSHEDCYLKRSQWMPGLKTIEEIVSPPLGEQGRVYTSF